MANALNKRQKPKETVNLEDVTENCDEVLKKSKSVLMKLKRDNALLRGQLKEIQAGDTKESMERRTKQAKDAVLKERRRLDACTHDRMLKEKELNKLNTENTQLKHSLKDVVPSEKAEGELVALQRQLAKNESQLREVISTNNTYKRIETRLQHEAVVFGSQLDQLEQLIKVLLEDKQKVVDIAINAMHTREITETKHRDEKAKFLKLQSDRQIILTQRRDLLTATHSVARRVGAGVATENSGVAKEAAVVPVHNTHNDTELIDTEHTLARVRDLIGERSVESMMSKVRNQERSNIELRQRIRENESQKVTLLAAISQFQEQIQDLKFSQLQHHEAMQRIAQYAMLIAETQKRHSKVLTKYNTQHKQLLTLKIAVQFIVDRVKATITSDAYINNINNNGNNNNNGEVTSISSASTHAHATTTSRTRSISGMLRVHVSDPPNAIIDTASLVLNLRQVGAEFLSRFQPPSASISVQQNQLHQQHLKQQQQQSLRDLAAQHHQQQQHSNVVVAQNVNQMVPPQVVLTRASFDEQQMANLFIDENPQTTTSPTTAVVDESGMLFINGENTNAHQQGLLFLQSLSQDDNNDVVVDAAVSGKDTTTTNNNNNNANIEMWGLLGGENEIVLEAENRPIAKKSDQGNSQHNNSSNNTKTKAVVGFMDEAVRIAPDKNFVVEEM